jgi:hypothetical protein
VNRVGDIWQQGDPLPPIGATLEARGGRDYVLIRRIGPTGWEWAVNNHLFQKCGVEMLEFWAPVKITQIQRDRKTVAAHAN